MADLKNPRPSSTRVDALRTALDQRLENESGILDLIVAAHGRGQAVDELYEQLHAAAQRDERLSELAFAYERLARDKRLRMLPPLVQAAFLTQAAHFFATLFGDPEGAEGYLERALGAAPGYDAAFKRLEASLVARGEGVRLSELYASQAGHRESKAEALELLRRASDIVEGFSDEGGRGIKILQEILRIDPSDARARGRLVQRLEQVGRFGDLAKLLEQLLAGDTVSTLAETTATRAKLVSLYARELNEIERALPHVEEMLRVEPTAALALDIGEKLLTHKGVAARIAAALGDAYDRSGRGIDAARALAVQIELGRGPKRLEAQKKLGLLYVQRTDLADAAKALALDEAIVVVDPGDDEVRRRYIGRSVRLDKRIEATRTLTRAASGCKDLGARARIGAEVGDLFMALGDAKRARAMYQSVLDAGGDDRALLDAARAMERLASEANDLRALAAVLGRLGDLEPDENARIDATVRLARLAEEQLRDPAAAIRAYRKLDGTRLEPEALEALERLYQTTGAQDELAGVLARRAAQSGDRELARSLSFRAADLRGSKADGRAVAIEAWTAFISTYGPARDALAKLVALLEHERRWEPLANALDADARLAPVAEQAPILARLGQLRAGKLSDSAGALDAYSRALGADPTDRPSRLAVDKMLAAGELRLRAADLLEPIVRKEGAHAAILRVLEARAALSEHPRDRLAALGEASTIASDDARDFKKSVDFAGRGLVEALAAQPAEVPTWIARITKLTTTTGDSARAAAAFQKALGDAPIHDSATALLARTTGDALCAAGDVPGALVAFRRALDYEPSDAALLEKLDGLLRDQGSPDERRALYEVALASATEPARRRELLHAIGSLERRELDDAPAAIATYRRAIDNDPRDVAAHAALIELFDAQGAWEASYGELARHLDLAVEEERVAGLVRLGEAAMRAGADDRARGHFVQAIARKAPATDEELTRIETFARQSGDAALVRQVLERRVETAADPSEEADWLERLGDAEVEMPEAAASRWRRAAELDPARATRMHERVIEVLPDDRATARKLAAIYEESGTLERLRVVYHRLVATSPTNAEAIQTLLAFEAIARPGDGLEAFIAEVETFLQRSLTLDERGTVLFSRARVLAADATSVVAASHAFRELLASGTDPAAGAEQAFEAFVVGRGAAGDDDRRWLCAYRARRATDGERAPALIAWAKFEESTGDLARAAELLGELLRTDPENDEALAERSRLFVALEAFDQVAPLLALRRDRAEGPARAQLELELGELLLVQLRRPADALDAIAPVLEANPGDAAALRLVEMALEANETAVRASKFLERAAENADDPTVAEALVERLLERCKGHEELAEVRRSWFEKLLELRAGDGERALTTAIRALDEFPCGITLWDRAEQHARELERPEVLVEAYTRALTRMAQDPGATSGVAADVVEDVGRRAVEFHEEWFDRPEAVVTLLRNVVALVPSSTWAFERLKLVYNLAERWEELFSLYDVVIGRSEDRDVRADLAHDAALVAKDLAGDGTHAIRYFEVLMALRPDARARASLERLYERGGHNRKLVELLVPDLATTEGDANEKLRLRLADLWLTGLAEPDAALAVIEPSFGGGIASGPALALLEKILASTGIGSPTRQATIDHLRKGYAAVARPVDLARVLRAWLEGLQGPPRAAVLRELAALELGVIGDLAAALDALAELVLLEPAAPERSEFERVADRCGEHARLASVLAEAAATSEPALRIELFSRAAEVAENRAGDRAAAIAHLRSVVGAQHADGPTLLRAARDLDRLLAIEGRRAERCEALEVLARVEPEAEGRRAALHELGIIALRDAGDAARAVDAFRAELVLVPDAAAARDGLVDALETAGRFRELVDALGERAAASTDPVAARADRVAIARVWGEKLGEQDRAIAAWSELRKERSDPASADALATLYEAAGRWDELVALLDAEAGETSDPARAADLWRRLGDVHREHSDAWGEAIACYELALEARGDDAGSRRGLEAIAFRFDLAPDTHRKTLTTAVRALERIYSAAADAAATIALVEPRLGVAEDDRGRARVLVETSALFEARDDAASAFDALWRAFGYEPSACALDDVVRLATDLGRWTLVADALRGDLAARLDGPTLRRLWFGVAIDARDRAEAQTAEDAFERALVHDPSSAAILEQLCALRRTTPDRALVATLLRLSEARGGDLDCLREAVDVSRGAVDDRVLAKTIAEKLLDAAEARWKEGRLDATATFAGPAEAVTWALDALVAALETTGPTRMVDLFLRGARLPFDAGERRRLRVRAADLADADLTITIYRELFDEDPNDAIATGRLEALYRQQGRTADLFVLREKQIAAASSPKAAVGLRFELACLLVDAGEGARASALLRENVVLDPEHRPSITKLAAIFEAAGNLAELVRLLEGDAQHLEAEGVAADAASAWARAAAIAETGLGDLTRAIADHRRAESLGATESLDALARLLSATGAHRDAAAMLERLIAVSAADGVVALTLRLGRSLVAAGDVDAARARLAQAAEGSGDRSPVRGALAELYRQGGMWRPLADLLAEDAAATTDRPTRIARLREAAELYAGRAGDGARAIPLLEQARELAPDDVGLRIVLASAFATSGRLDEAAASLRTILASYGTRRPKERALVHHELAKIALLAGDRARALGEFDAALRIDPAHPRVLHALGRLAFEEGQFDRASRTYRALLLVLRRPREAGDDAARDIGRAEVLLELSEIAERQGESERAKEHLESAFETARESDEERERLFTALRTRGRHATLASALEGRIAVLDEGPEVARMLDELARVYEGPLARPEQALEARLRAMRMLPDDASIRDAAAELAPRIGQTQRLLDELETLVARAPSQGIAIDLLLIVGRARERDLHDEAGAAAALERARAMLAATDARLPGLYRGLQRIYERLGDARAEADVLGRTVALTHADPAELVHAMHRLAVLRLADPSTRREGLDLLRRAADLRSDPEQTERTLRQAIARDPSDVDVARFFERFARESNGTRALVDALVLLDANGAASSNEVEPLREAVQLARELGEPALAETLLRRVLARAIDTTPVWALIELAGLREAAGDFAESVDLRERAAHASEPDDERRLLLAVAALAVDKLGDLGRAARIYEDLRHREPADRDIWYPLADVYRKLGDTARLGELLEETGPLVDTHVERAAMSLERARLLLSSDEPAALRLLYEVIEEDPAQTEAAMLLASLLEQRGRLEELATLLARRLEAAKDREDLSAITSLSMRLGGLLEQQGDEQAALDVYYAAVDWDKTNRDASRAILRLCLARDDSMDIGDALEQMLDLEVGEAAVELAIQLAQLRGAHGDPAGAEKALEKGYDLCPTSAKLRDQLAARYEAREAWGRLAALLVRDAAVREPGAERVAVLLRAAALLETRASDPHGAVKIYEQALASDPGDRGVLRALVHALEASGDRERAIGFITEAIGRDPNDGALYRDRAALHDALGKGQLALVDLESAYEKGGGRFAGDLARHLEQMVASRAPSAQTDAPEVRAGERVLRLRLAEVLARAGEADQARTHLVDLTRKDAKDKVALRALGDLEAKMERWDPASAAYRRLVVLEDGDALVDAALRLAEACERGGRLADARSGLERAVRARPNDGTVRERLRTVYNVTGASRELAAMILEDAAAAPDVAGRFPLLVHAGRLLLDSDGPGDAEQAVPVFEEARSLRPEEPDLTLLLADAYVLSQRNDEARALLGGAVAAQKGRRARVLGPVHQRLARIAFAEGDHQGALVQLAKAFENDPHSSVIAMELGLFAVDMNDTELAGRALRAVTLMKLAQPGSFEGTTKSARAVAYYNLGRMAEAAGDRRKARMMLEKSVIDDPDLEEAKAFLEQLRSS